MSAGWLREAEANTRQRFLQDDHATLAPELQRQAVDEGFARLALGYATGRVLESQAPSGLRSFLTAFKHLYYETLRLGRDINTWRERGTMDAELHAALKLATGHGEEGDALGMRRKGEVMASEPDRIEPGPSFSISRDEALAIGREIEAQKPLKISAQGIFARMTAKEAIQWAEAHGVEGRISHLPTSMEVVLDLAFGAWQDMTELHDQKVLSVSCHDGPDDGSSGCRRRHLLPEGQLSLLFGDLGRGDGEHPAACGSQR